MPARKATSKKKVTKKAATTKAAAGAKTQSVKLRPMRLQTACVTIRGTTPLIQHKMSEKSKRQMRERKAGKKTRDREPCNPEVEFEEATYRLSDGSYAIPVISIKASMITAAHRDLGIEKTLVRKALFIEADEGTLVEMKTTGPKMREDVVRVQSGSADLRYRPEFQQWEVDLRIQYDQDLLTLDDIVNLLNRAGFGVGVGEWRPEKGPGLNGRFQVAMTKG